MITDEENQVIEAKHREWIMIERSRHCGKMAEIERMKTEYREKELAPHPRAPHNRHERRMLAKKDRR